MYAALWRILPGPWWVRLFLVLVVLGAIVWLLFNTVFPWLSPIIEPYILPPGEIGVE